MLKKEQLISGAVALVSAIISIAGSWVTNIAPPEQFAWGLPFSVGLATVLGVLLALIVPVLSNVLIANLLSFSARRILLFVLGILCAIVFVASGFVYWGGLTSKTVIYPPEGENRPRVYIGNEFKDVVETFLEQNPALRNDPVGLLRKFAGDPANVWTRESLLSNQKSLSIRYVICATFMVLAFLFIIEASLAED